MPIPNPLARELAAHKLRFRRDAEALVFGRTASESFVPSTVRNRALAAWKAENERRIAQAEAPESVERLATITLHEARHTCASLLIAPVSTPRRSR